MTRSFPLNQYMLDTFLEAVGRGEVRRNNIPVATPVQKSILKNVTTKAIYTSRMTDMLVPPKVGGVRGKCRL